MRRHAIALVLLAALAGCDPSERTAGSGSEGPAVDRRSREHETCGHTADCAGELRCFDGVCRRGGLSLVGDLYSAVGDRELTAGRAREASQAYAAALARYEQDKLEPPALLLCSHGSSLTSEAGADAPKLELAARLLHRCLLGAPAGSFLRQRALADLAVLMENGLDPELLARREPADQYLTRKPGEALAAAAPASTAAPAPASTAAPAPASTAAPAPASTAAPAPAGAAAPASTAAPAPAGAAPAAVAPLLLQVQVVLDTNSRARSVRKLTERLDKSSELDAALTACWKAHFDKTQKDTFAVTVPLRYGHAWDEDETYLSSWVKMEESAASGEPAQAEATTCARAAFGPIVEAEGKKLREESRWQAVATLTVAPVKP